MVKTGKYSMVQCGYIKTSMKTAGSVMINSLWDYTQTGTFSPDRVGGDGGWGEKSLSTFIS